MVQFQIGNKLVGPVYFIAEIGSNHNGSLERAKHLCMLARRSGADCAKFQHYRADKLASRGGFEGLDLAHYTDNPYDVFKKYEVPWEWTPTLKEYCDSIGIEFMSTPYDLEAVDHLEPYVNAYKIGSGDITYTPLINRVDSKKKPIILSTGAADFTDVMRAVGQIGSPLCLMQCNTNYTNGIDNAGHLQLRLLTEYQNRLCYEDRDTIGFSDHNTAPWIIAAAVGMGARVIERHFTDNIHNEAPDSPFAMDPYSYLQMVEMVRWLERAMGDGVKKVEENEKETVVLQRRAIRSSAARTSGWVLSMADLVCLRPCPADGIPPYRIGEVVGKELKRDIGEGELIREDDLV